MRGEPLEQRLITRNDHYKNEEDNLLDPDEGNTWSCSVCNLPIFSTPFIIRNSSAVSLVDGSSSKVICQHDQCANLPKQLNGSDLHPHKPLLLREQNSKNPRTIPTCDKCSKRCGAMFFHCPDRDCSVILDVLCALKTIKILHRSHEHRLMAIRGAWLSSFICSACGTRHHDDNDQAPDLFYICHPCRFWIHPECASLPNAVVLKHRHQHPLVLRYDRPTSSLRNPYSYRYYSKLIADARHTCAICKHIIESLGLYSCNKCSYYVHIMCAVSDHQNFKPVLISEARLPDLVRLPIPDEHTSVIQYITETTTTSTNAGGTSSSNSDDDDFQLHENPLSFDEDNNDEHLPLDQLHEHPLILHHRDDNDHHLPRLCHACVQLIISPPFYKCSDCLDFFLHNCCARLPRTLAQHPACEDQPLSLILRPASRFLDSTFHCQSCRRSCHGFAYLIGINSWANFHLDVLCALMPASITHAAHASAHILYMNSKVTSTDYFGNEEITKCDCCGIGLHGLFYECRTCRNFRIHVRCALLPDTIRHKFDQHPLKLTTTRSSYNKRSESSGTADDDTEELMFCEICEFHIDNRKWYYSCDQCDHSFHADCFPCLDDYSMIKYGATGPTIRLKCHDCPLTRVRGHTICGFRCGCCQGTFIYDSPAWECSDCYFRIHDDCARDILELH